MADTSFEAPASASDDLGGLASRYRRHLPLVLAITGVCTAAAIAASMAMEPKYKSSAFVQFQPTTALVGGPVATTSNVPPTPEQVIDTQAEILRSPSLAKGVVERLGLTKDPEFNAAIPDGTRASGAGGGLKALLKRLRPQKPPSSVTEEQEAAARRANEQPAVGAMQ